METVFRRTQYPDPKVLSVLATRLDIPMEKICVSIHIYLYTRFIVYYKTL